MNNILVTGADGQLGSELRRPAANRPDFRFFFTDVAELDITDGRAADEFIARHNIRAVVNCAAYTAVDKAESDEAAATKINAGAVEALAVACRNRHTTLIHISTDYVFDGCASLPYGEEHSVSPRSAYGRSKLAGEKAAATNPDTVIIRTSWLYSAFGNNFVKTMLRLGREREHLNVVFDQVGTPTYAADLAEAIMTVVDAAAHNRLQRGVFHYSGEGVCSWYDFAHAVMQLSGSKCAVHPIETKDYPTPAERPAYSVLNKSRIKTAYGIKIPHWHDSLVRCLEDPGMIKI